MQSVVNDFSFNENEQKKLKLTEEELKALEGFSNLSPAEKENLKDLIFNFSLVLYKSFKNEST